MNIGDKVHWTHIGSSRRIVSLTRREGEIVAIDDQVATVKKHSGKTERVAISRLRPINARSQITEFIEMIKAGEEI